MKPGTRYRPWAAIGTFVAVAFACATAASALAAPPAPRSIPRGEFVPGEAIVRFEPGTPTTERREARAAAGVGFERTLRLPRAQVVDVEGSVASAVRRLESQPGVDYAQPNYVYEATALEPPDDTFFGQLWGLSDPAMPDPGVGALEAWETTEGAGETIAVLDTGVDLTHPDIAANLWDNPSPTKGDVHGYDFVDGDGDPSDYNFHGTHVAATAAALAGNSLGIAGVAPEAEIMAVRVLDGDGFGSTAEIAEGIEYAGAHGADVINMSLGGPAGAGDKAMSDAIAAAPETVVVVAAGNEAADNDTKPHTPCALPNANLICVAALNQGNGTLASFSNYGEETVDIAAPGTNVLSAKAQYGAPLFADGFELEPPIWSTEVANEGIEWALTSPGFASETAATDSPLGDYGQAEDEEFLAASYLLTTDPISLAGEHGCRVHFRAKYQVEPFFDAFVAGGWAPGIERLDVLQLDGETPNFPNTYFKEEASISDLDGRTDVHPVFGIWSDYEVEYDGAYVDDVRVICRASAGYLDAIASSADFDEPGSGSYIRFQGTSMATPHVAGVVALVRAAAPGLDAGEAIDAVLSGASAIPLVASGKRTATEGIADACKAVAIATGRNVEAACPASSEPHPQPPEAEGAAEIAPASGGTVGASSLSGGATLRSAARRPQTFIRRHPPRRLRTRGRRTRALFVFGSNQTGVVFLCRIDRQLRWRLCPRRYARRFGRGRHVLRVKARNVSGLADRTPAVFRFRVRRR